MAPKICGKAVKKAGKGQKKPTTDKKKKKRDENPTISTSKFTPRLESAPKHCQSWTASWTTSLNELLLKLQDLRTTTNEQPSLAVRSKLQFDCCCPLNWPSTQSVKEPRLSPSTQAPTRIFDYLLLAAGSTLLHNLTFNPAFLKATKYFVSQF